eukprot:364309-Chlamydomonas_euryale.AAC.1
MPRRRRPDVRDGIPCQEAFAVQRADAAERTAARAGSGRRGTLGRTAPRAAAGVACHAVSRTADATAAPSVGTAAVAAEAAAAARRDGTMAAATPTRRALRRRRHRCHLGRRRRCCRQTCVVGTPERPACLAQAQTAPLAAVPQRPARGGLGAHLTLGAQAAVAAPRPCPWYA